MFTQLWSWVIDMYVDDSDPDECTQLWQNCQQLTSIFLLNATVKTVDKILPSESHIDINTQKSLYVIKQGSLKETYNDNIIINYQPGDLIGAHSLLQNKLTRITTDFSITVDEYDGMELLEYIRADNSRNMAWNQYLMNLLQSYQILICEYKTNEVRFHPEIRHYGKGDIIIHQGGTDDEVFTLMSGAAQAWVDNIVVGDINRDEVFGAIAALTKTPRTATVTALTACSALVVPSKNFTELIKTRPDTVTKLITDMARTILSNNETIVNLSKQKNLDNDTANER